MHFQISPMKQSAMSKRHYIIPEYIPATGQQEVCWKASHAGARSRQKSFFSNVLQPQLNPGGTPISWKIQHFLTFFFSCHEREKGGEGVKQGELGKFSTGSHHSADLEKCNRSYIIIK